MTIIRDEQIIASIYCIENWKKILPAFMEVFYENFVKAFIAMDIIWQRDEIGLKWLTKKYPAYFSWENNHLNILKERGEMFDAFLATLDDDTKNILATNTKEACKVA